VRVGIHIRKPQGHSIHFLQPELRLSGVVHEVVGASIFFDANEEFDTFGKWDLLFFENSFDVFGPVEHFFEGYRIVKIGLCDDSEGRIAEEIELALGVSVW
jgi:hypothetical protein